ncbi:uncharacterized protein LACBIDRAFT_303888 [Laccaria bicolor S238N-H82]|uniref:Predicted protein n=1 Tax=Laccaria bicolor (strain S238N-H82 / ATCC MYA-4686) TaxID=486041 RepID=B0DKK7_LACBS|nr:uncharacterized protein LACBIDRAFT_303888 [Laccaria bicolor S238N-H82]EDR04961.1 predicted protein [Laccaria bicolor S238N-H82]|eukprot:XP_001884351.1 predicted protein [Laccaria bicolor S238N-H82]
MEVKNEDEKKFNINGLKEEEDRKLQVGHYSDTIKAEFQEDVKANCALKVKPEDWKGIIKGELSGDKSALSTVTGGPVWSALSLDDDDIDVNDFPIGPVEEPYGDDDDIDVNDFPNGPVEEPYRTDDDIDVNNFPIGCVEPMACGAVDSPMEDVDNGSQGEHLKTHLAVAVKEELRDDISLLNPQPVTQPRLEFDGVLLPSLAEIRQRWALEANLTQANSLDEVEEMNKKVESWRNPKMKKQENLVMDLGVTSRRLLAAGIHFLDLELEDELKDVMVSRKFMAMRFGGSAQETTPNISKANFNKHGFDNFMYCNTDAHSMAPEIPGAGGLFFNPDHIPGFTGIKYRLFTRIQRTPKALWTYVGEYEALVSQSLSKAEWNEQTNRVKSTWAHMIFKKDWGSNVRLRIFTRKKHNVRTPTEEQLEKVWDSGEYKGKVTAGEIQAAFDCGEEVLHVWVMKCVGFDKSLQRQINEELKTWDSSEASRKTNKKKVVRGVKRKRGEHDSDEGGDSKDKDEEEEADLESEDEDGWENDHKVDLEVTELQYRSRGTRSRPIHIS